MYIHMLSSHEDDSFTALFYYLRRVTCDHTQFNTLFTAPDSILENAFEPIHEVVNTLRAPYLNKLKYPSRKKE